MARVASFTSTGQQLRPSGTLAELMARRRDLAQRMAAPQQPIQHWMQGVGNLAQQAVAGLQEGRLRREEEAGRAQLAQAVAGIDQKTGIATPEQLQTMMGLDPDIGLGFIKTAIESRRAAANRDQDRAWSVEDREDNQAAAAGLKPSYGPVLTGDAAKAAGLDPTKSYQLNATTKQYDQIGGGGSTINVNPPTAETAAKVGLANGFLDNYDSILQAAQNGDMTGVNYLTAVQFGRGAGGSAYRNLLQGTEAMIRLLTGAGMSQSEAEGRVTQYEPAVTDDAATLVSKIKGLRQALDNVKEGIDTRGKPQQPDAPQTVDPNAPPVPDAATPPPDDGIPTLGAGDRAAYDALQPGAKYRNPGDPIVYTKPGATAPRQVGP